MKEYSSLPTAPALLQPYHQTVKRHIQAAHCGGGLTPLQRSSRCILQPQETLLEVELLVLPFNI